MPSHRHTHTSTDIYTDIQINCHDTKHGGESDKRAVRRVFLSPLSLPFFLATTIVDRPPSSNWEANAKYCSLELLV